jgi:hypothetical protein
MIRVIRVYPRLNFLWLPVPCRLAAGVPTEGTSRYWIADFDLFDPGSFMIRKEAS